MASSRLSSSVPSPRRWNASRTTRANSASSYRAARLSRPTARISWSPVSGSLELGHQGHLAVVVDEADPRQPLVGDALAQLHGLEVAQVDARSESVSWNRTISGSSSGRIGRIVTAVAVLRCVQGDDVLGRIGADGRAAAAGPRVDLRAVQDHAGVERDQPLRRGEQRVDVDLLDPALLDDQLAEADQELLQRGQSTGVRPRTPFSAVKIRVCSIIRRASVVFSGGRASARSLKTSTSWPPVPNSSTGPNCGSRLLPTISS